MTNAVVVVTLIYFADGAVVELRDIAVVPNAVHRYTKGEIKPGIYGAAIDAAGLTRSPSLGAYHTGGGNHANGVVA